MVFYLEEGCLPNLQDSQSEIHNREEKNVLNVCGRPENTMNCETPCHVHSWYCTGEVIMGVSIAKGNPQEPFPVMLFRCHGCPIEGGGVLNGSRWQIAE